ncbi:hypothetical protein [Psychroflexus tropicus]|uniref:hypothetical protein n=1 Tax=Psychroflexus tropicus TaxID=197345 RepID=UPI0003697234|nr:hypothetical protein [Psychroflexus tropicus]
MNFKDLLYRWAWKAFFMIWYFNLTIAIYNLLYQELIRQEFSALAHVLDIIFMVWLIRELMIKVVIRPMRRLFRYIYDVL